MPTQKQLRHWKKLGQSRIGRTNTPEHNRKSAEKRSGKLHPKWKGGRLIDSNGYVDLLIKSWPSARKNGYIREHRYVMEKHIGRCLKSTEHIHHKDGNKKNNSIDNLEILGASEHMKSHRRSFGCSVKDCKNRHQARGYCKVHWSSKYYYPLILKPRQDKHS